jgi:hypothetical protein
VITLHASLADTGVYAGTLTIGGLIERGDIHQLLTSQPEVFGDLTGRTLDPEVLADAVWKLYSGRDRAEEIFSVFT